ncbi:MAG: phage terminase large subunit family protein [Candidatus Bathyarchaeota archaeon]
MADRASAMRQLSGWMTRNLKLNGRPYSFKNHEMQKAIASDLHPRKYVKKCSQVGITELAFRITASIAAVARARIIYIFPSAKFSLKMSNDRFWPIINESPILYGMQHSDSKSAEMRKLGNSTVYFSGASGTTQAISIPATHLITDEKDFCDPTILGQYNSRLRHQEEDPVTGHKGSRLDFSTPTLPNYGISRDYEESDQKRYTVKCSKCNTTQAPDYYNDFIVPGYDHEIALFGVEHLSNPKYRIADAYVKCRKCGHDLWQDLLNPAQREWVARYPDRLMMSGYAISPIDVPRYNSVSSIFRQLAEYTVQDHRNFVLGLEYEDKNNSFLMSIFDNYSDAKWVELAEAKTLTLSGIRIGVDIGKTSHLVVFKRVSSKTIHLIHAARLHKDEGFIYTQIQEYIDAFNPEITVIDAQPDFSTAQAIVNDNSIGKAFGCEYHRGVKGAYTYLDPNPDTGVVKADRSGTLSELMKLHNSGGIHYPVGIHEVNEEVRPHLKAIKKVMKPTEFGDAVSFPKTGEPDHYGHAMNYAYMADVMASDDGLFPTLIRMSPSVSVVRIGQNVNS